MDPVIASFCRFLDASPTPWHAAATAAKALSAAGLVSVDPANPWPACPDGGFLAQGGTVIAWRPGTQSADDAGFRLIAAHTDSPNLRLKPQPVQRGHGLVRLGVEVYGGVILATWADRDLGLAGLVHLRGGRTVQVDLRRPLCRIPNLAIHLNRTVNDDGLKLNPQTMLPAVLSLDVDGPDPLKALLAAEVGAGVDDVLTWDLCLVDVAPATISGADGAFLHSGRLDNLAMSHAALEAFLTASRGNATAVIALFDHEEIGSHTSRGADSNLLERTLARLAADPARALARSALLSADMAHAVHPAWPDKHEPHHMPRLGGGPVIKQNASWRYATEGAAAARFAELAEGVGVKPQWFVTRSDLACGSTVGPIVAARLGVPTVDIGNPMLSMHSAREMAAVADHAPMIRVMARWFSS